MSEEEARLKLEAWEREKHADQRQTKADCIAGYTALAEGKVLVQLDAAIRGGGFHTSGFPKLAIARADRDRVRLWWPASENVARYDARNSPYGPLGNAGSLARTVDMQSVPNVQRDNRYVSLDGWAQVPLLPAEHRPLKGQLKQWFILWEVEKWFARDTQVEPDRDPMLLEHVAGQLYAVLAEWELTDLERAVMAGALRAEAV